MRIILIVSCLDIMVCSIQNYPILSTCRATTYIICITHRPSSRLYVTFFFTSVTSSRSTGHKGRRLPFRHAPPHHRPASSLAAYDPRSTQKRAIGLNHDRPRSQAVESRLKITICQKFVLPLYSKQDKTKLWQ